MWWSDPRFKNDLQFQKLFRVGTEGLNGRDLDQKRIGR